MAGRNRPKERLAASAETGQPALKTSRRIAPVSGSYAFEGADSGSIRVSVHEPLPAAHPFYAKVGRVASAWAHLEHLLDLIIWDLMGDGGRQRMACVTSQVMGVGPRCKIILSLGATWPKISPEIFKPAQKLMSDSYHVADLRARWVHDPWYLDKGTEEVGQFKAMPYSDRRFGIKAIPQDTVEDTIEKIEALHVRASSLRASVLHALEASRQ